MRLILWVLVLFAVAVAVALTAEYNTGHFVIEMPPYEKIELSLDYAVAGLVAVLVVFYFLVRMMVGLFDRRNIRAESLMLESLQAFFEGDYAQAKKSSVKGVKLAKTPQVKAINAAVAARSAQKVADIETRDAVLAEAEQGDDSEEKAVWLVTKIELLLKDGRYQEALDTFKDLYSSGGLQPTAVLQLELEAQRQAKNWDAVLEITGILIHRHPLNSGEFEKLRLEAHQENFKIKGAELETLNNYWNKLPEHERNNSRLAAVAARAYISLGDCATAHKIIENNVQNDWDAELIALYAECLNYHVSRQIECAEVWLKAQPNNAGLLLTLGKLCAHCELWGKAQNYLEASISVEPSTTAYFALAQLNEKLGKHELTMDNYSKAVELTLGRKN